MLLMRRKARQNMEEGNLGNERSRGEKEKEREEL